jgi:hypothetical protein
MSEDSYDYLFKSTWLMEWEGREAGEGDGKRGKWNVF